MKNNIGIMQGRLSNAIENQIQVFPKESWKKEFMVSKQIGFDSIEWIFDTIEKNPILDDEGIKEIKNISTKYDVKINSLCADYFMIFKLFDVSDFQLEKNLDILKKLLNQCSKLGIRILEIPFVDSSSLKSIRNKAEIVKNLEKSISLVQDLGMFLTFETDLAPEEFRELLLKFNHPNIKANYDIGNSTSNGYNTKHELEILREWIINIHIKDRILNGHTVPLGKGDADFNSFFSTLKKIDYKGDLIIQGAREDIPESKISPEETCLRYLNFVKQYLDKYSFSTR